MHDTIISPVGESLPFHPDNSGNFTFLLGEEFVEKHNVAWRVEVAQEDPANPILEKHYPWESACVFSHGTVLKDPIDGLWKAWYIAVPEHELSPSCERRLCYAESRDGLNWVRPELDICSYEGYERTNILMSIESGGTSQHASVLIHPDAPEESRYEMFIMRLPGWECDFKVVEGFPVPVGQESHQEANFHVGLFRYRSSDGKRWRPWHQAKVDTSDSGWVTQLADGSYEMHHKITIPALPGCLVPYDVAAGVCRIMVRRISADGQNWSTPEVTITPDWQDPQDTQFMEITPMPVKNGTIGLVTVYHLLSQTIDLQWAATRNGKTWWRPSRRASVPLRPLGDVGGGMIFPMFPLIEDEGRIYVYYAGCEGLHNDFLSTTAVENMQGAGFKTWPNYYEPLTVGNDTTSPVRGCLWFQSSLCRASWEAGRLWAAVTASGGRLPGDMLTKVINGVKGKRLAVNVVTVGEGALEAELVADGKVIPGFGREDCTPISGNHKDAFFRWKGGDACPAERLQVRFYLRQARFYGFEWEE